MQSRAVQSEEKNGAGRKESLSQDMPLILDAHRCHSSHFLCKTLLSIGSLQTLARCVFNPLLEQKVLNCGAGGRDCVPSHNSGDCLKQAEEGKYLHTRSNAHIADHTEGELGYLNHHDR